MNKIHSLRVTLGALLLGLVGPVFMILLMLAGPDITGYHQYREVDSFVAFDVKVRAFTVWEDAISFELEHREDSFYDAFFLEKENLALACDNGLKNILTEGLQMRISAHPAYLGDGWSYRIVALQTEEKVYLSFEEGYANLMVEAEASAQRALKLLLISGAFPFAGVLLIVSVFLPGKKKTS